MGALLGGIEFQFLHHLNSAQQNWREHSGGASSA